jgi:excisionase family DNA binding protein
MVDSKAAGGRMKPSTLVETRVLTIHQVADQLRVSPRTLRRWLQQGRIEGIELHRGPRGGYLLSEKEVQKIADFFKVS